MKDVKFEFYIGDTYTRDFTIDGYSEPIDNVFLTIKKEDDDKDFLLQYELDNGITLTDIVYDEDGTTILSRTYNILIGANDTETLKPDTEYPMDVEIITIKDGTSIKKTIIKGVLLLDSATTRAWDE